MVGTVLIYSLQAQGKTNLLTRTQAELDLSIDELTAMDCNVVGYCGDVRYGTSKLMGVFFLPGMGWRPKTNIADGLAMTYRSYIEYPTVDSQQMINMYYMHNPDYLAV